MILDYIIIASSFRVHNRKDGKIMAEGVRKRGKTWSYYFDAAKISGERKKIEKGGFRTQKEALDARAAAIAEYNSTGRNFEPSQMSVSDYLDYWLEHAVKNNVGQGFSHGTYRVYRGQVKNHLKPKFGQYRLSSFQYSSDIIQAWIDEMKAKYAKRTVNNLLHCLSGAMSYAVLPLKYTQNNPCIPVTVGKMPLDPQAKAYREYVCQKDEFKRILQRFPYGDNFHISLLVPYHIGTRIAETFAINYLEDVDFKKHEIRIDKQMVLVDGKWTFQPPKYDSYRTVRIGKTLEKELKNEMIRHKKNRMKLGGQYLKTYLLPDRTIVQYPADIDVPYKEIMLLCMRDNGKFLAPNSFSACSRIIHKELGNELFHAHCLRHTHGTMLAEAGVNPRTVMERLGHRDIATTLQNYTFNTDRMVQQAVDVIEKYVN